MEHVLFQSICIFFILFVYETTSQFVLEEGDVFLSGYEVQLNVIPNDENSGNLWNVSANTQQYLRLDDLQPVQQSVFSLQMRLYWENDENNQTHTMFFYGNANNFLWIGGVSDIYGNGYIIYKKNSTIFKSQPFQFYFSSSAWSALTFTANSTHMQAVNEYSGCGFFPTEVFAVGSIYTLNVEEGFDFASMGAGSSCSIGWVEDTEVRAIIVNQTKTAFAPFPGRIDEIRMFGKTPQATAPFANSYTWNLASDPGLTAEWSITESSGNVITDNIGGRTFTIVNNSNCLAAQSGQLCPPPTVATEQQVSAGGFVDLATTSIENLDWEISVSSPSTVFTCIVNSTECEPTQSGQYANGSAVIRLEPLRAACGTVSTILISSNQTFQKNVNVTLYSPSFNLSVDQSSLSVPFSGGIFQLTGTFGSNGNLDGISESVTLDYNHNDLSDSELSAFVNTSGLFVNVTSGYGTGVLILVLCGQTANVSLRFPEPVIDSVTKNDTRTFHIVGQNFPTNKIWNPSDVTFTDSSGQVALCTVDETSVTGNFIQCSLTNNLAGGKVEVTLSVGDQTAFFTFQNSEKSKSQNVGVIVGPVVAGVVVVSAIAAFLVYRKKQKNKEEPSQQKEDVEMVSHNPNQTSASLIQDKWNIDFNEIQIQKEIGKGGFGVIYLAKWRNTDCVVKQLGRTNAVEEFLKEASNVRHLRPHPNICTVLGVCASPEHPLCLVMEYVQQGSLWTMLSTQQLHLDQNTMIDFALDIANGMHHLHSENIIHCDLACRNVLVAAKSSDSYTLKITDFGLSRIMESDMYKANESAVFPVRWSSPELLTKRLITKSVDVWAYGVTLWEMIEVKQPYYELASNSDVIKAVCGAGLRLTQPREAPDSLWTIMQSCWADNPAHRPTFGEICSSLNQIKRGCESGGNHAEISQTATYFSQATVNANNEPETKYASGHRTGPYSTQSTNYSTSAYDKSS